MDAEDVANLEQLVEELLNRGDDLRGFAMRATFYEPETHPESHPLLAGMQLVATANDLTFERRVLAFKDKNLLQYDLSWTGNTKLLVSTAQRVSEALSTTVMSMNLRPQFDFTFIGSPALPDEEE
jgi:hypothetical protein